MKIIEINNSTLKKLSPLLNKYKYKNFYSCREITNKEKVEYFLNKLSKIKKSGRIIALEISGKIKAFGWVELSDWDTRHFGFKMAKVGIVSQSGYSDDKKYSSILLNEIERYCIRQQIKHITIRLPLNQISLIHSAEENHYLLMAQASAYTKNLTNYTPEAYDSNIKLRFCKPSDLKELRKITEKSFRPQSGWFDRFHNDPTLSDQKADLLYKEWINNCYRSYLRKANNKIIIATYNNKVVGYLSGELDSEATKSFGKKVAYIPLNAVDETFRRRGIYSLLVQAILNWYKKKNVDLVHILTQSGTIGVQKVWMKQKDVSSETQCVYHKYLGDVNRIIIAGYHNIGYSCLEELIKRKENIVGVITHKDNPNEVHWFKCVEKLAIKHGIPVFTPENINSKSTLALIKELKPDIIFSFMFRKLFKKPLLEIPKYGCINLHPSLLPKYRGRSPLNWVLINGDNETGATLHYMELEADSGDSISQIKVTINKDDDILCLHNKVALASVDMFKKVFPLIKTNDVKRIPQNYHKATYFKGRSPQDGRIDWNKKAEELHNFIKALVYPFPGAFCLCRDKKIIIWKSKVKKTKSIVSKDKPGKIVRIGKNYIEVLTKKGCLVITSLQIDNNKERIESPALILKKYNISNSDVFK